MAELLTIPFFIAQIVFLFFGALAILKGERNPWTITSILSLAICTAITISSVD